MNIFGKLSVISLVAVFGCIFFAGPTHAATQPTFGLSISPLRKELAIAPGSTQGSTLILINSTKQPMTVHMSAEKFTVTNQQYDYKFDPNAAIVKWVDFSLDDFTLDPGKSQKVKYKIGVPLTSEPGGNYFSLFASTTTTSDNGQIKSQQRVASLVYLTVGGDVTKTGKLISLKTPWLISGQDDWTMAIQNSGTTHFHSDYSVTVQNLFGGKIGSYQSDALILPASVRSVTNALPEPSWPGVYKAIYSISMGDNPTINDTRVFIYIPLWSVGSLAVLILMIVATILYVRSIPKKK